MSKKSEDRIFCGVFIFVACVLLVIALATYLSACDTQLAPHCLKYDRTVTVRVVSIQHTSSRCSTRKKKSRYSCDTTYVYAVILGPSTGGSTLSALQNLANDDDDAGYLADNLTNRSTTSNSTTNSTTILNNQTKINATSFQQLAADYGNVTGACVFKNTEGPHAGSFTVGQIRQALLEKDGKTCVEPDLARYLAIIGIVFFILFFFFVTVGGALLASVLKHNPQNATPQPLSGVFSESRPQNMGGSPAATVSRTSTMSSLRDFFTAFRSDSGRHGHTNSLPGLCKATLETIVEGKFREEDV